MEANRRGKKVNDAVARIRELLGLDVLLLHWPHGMKGDKRKWKHLTIDSMQDADYLAKLASGNIGVAQGDRSGGLCSVDIDLNEEVDGFIALNPALENSLCSKGSRGCNIWFCAIDGSPPTRKIKTKDGKAWGELRANGSQTIIHGKHPSGCEYRLLVETAPVKIALADIVWPAHVINPLEKEHKHTLNHSAESCVLNSVDCASMACAPVPLCAVSLCDTAPAELVLANIEAVRQRQSALKERFPELAELYEKFIEPKFKAAAGHRNGFIVEAAPFVYCVVSRPLALRLLEFFYEMNRHLFKDPPEQHRYEAAKMLESVAASYLGKLAGTERQIYDALDGFERDVFRIVRDLALWPESKREPLTFFMSCKEMGDRLQINRRMASRILRRFEEYGIIQCLERGKPWIPGQKPMASVFRWLLPTRANEMTAGGAGV